MKKIILTFILLLFLTLPACAEPAIPFYDAGTYIVVELPSKENGGYYLIKNPIQEIHLSPERPSVLQYSYIEYPLTKAEKFDLIAARIHDHVPLDDWDKLEGLVYTIQMDLHTKEVRLVSTYFYSSDNTWLAKMDLSSNNDWFSYGPGSIGERMSTAAMKYRQDSQQVGTSI